MTVESKKTVAVKDLDADSQARIQQFVLDNQARICAPFDGMDKTYTPEESDKITSGIRGYFIERGVIQGDHDDILDRVYTPFEGMGKKLTDAELKHKRLAFKQAMQMIRDDSTKKD
jgi:hypothetical protein